MINKLSALQCILCMRIQKIRSDFLKEEQLHKTCSEQLRNLHVRKQALLKQREQNFLRRHDSEYLHVLLEHLQTLQLSLYRQHESSTRKRRVIQNTLLYLIARRKIIEKIKVSRYFKSKR